MTSFCTLLQQKKQKNKKEIKEVEIFVTIFFFFFLIEQVDLRGGVMKVNYRRNDCS
jgi:hypothetical protein